MLWGACGVLGGAWGCLGGARGCSGVLGGVRGCSGGDKVLNLSSQTFLA